MDAAVPVADVRAILFATPRAAPDLPVDADFPAALLPVGHAPLVVRLIERLARCGVTEIDLVVCDRPELLRDVLGDGGRWGVRLRWHLATDPDWPYAALRSCAIATAGRVLVGHADRWIDVTAIRRLAAEDQVLLQLDDADALVWTGWASIAGDRLRAPFTGGDREALRAELVRRGSRASVLSRASPAPVIDARHLLSVQCLAEEGRTAADLPPEWIRTPWGAISPRARVHPDARIAGPVLIGPGCLVAAGARVGPGVVLSRDVVVGPQTSVRAAVVLPGTYLGRALDVHDAIVNGGRVRHVALDVETELPRSDGLMLSLEAQADCRPSLWGRVAAASVAITLIPGLAAAALFRRRNEPALPWGTQQVIVGLDATTRRMAVAPLRCPRAGTSTLRHVLAHYGGLLDVVQGRRCWFGVRPRHRGEWYALSPEWQSLLATAPVGLVNAPAWVGDDDVRVEACAAADAFYVVRRNWRENLRIALAALRRGLGLDVTAVRRGAPGDRG